MATDPATVPDQVRPPTCTVTDTLLPDDGPLVVAIPVLPGEDGTGPILGPGGEELSTELDLDLLQVVEVLGTTGAAGEASLHPTPEHPTVQAVVLVGVGDAGPVDLRAAGAALARTVKDRAVLTTSLSALADDDGLRALVVGLVLGSFEFHWRGAGPTARPVREVRLLADPDRGPVLERAVTVSRAGWLARELATTPANVKNPRWLADRASAIAGDGSGLDVTVLDERQLARDGFGGLLAVGGASDSPPRLIRLDYRPRRARGHIALVGKGITFDTGGLSIKPAESMVNMKRDMTGGAVVIATMSALAAVDCPVRVTGLVAAAENAIGGSAYRPGDVIRHYGGRTTEVTNTDAEGRLVLADALAYAAAKVRPDALVDVATLTGAVKVALGLRTGGLFSNDETLAGALLAAGSATGERLWRMPLAADYEEKLASKVADADNAPGGPGAIIAALFLQHFTGGLPWAHLDIASVGDAPEDQGEWTAGPTGFGVRALLHWLGADDPLADVR